MPAEYFRLAVYDVTGREVARLIDGLAAAGKHEIAWNARALPIGAYVYRITAGTFTATKWLVLTK